jgi:hypothetical protein
MVSVQPTLYRPPPPLADYVEFFGHWRHSGPSYRSRALPRGAVTIVLDVGRRQQLDFDAADGRTRLPVSKAADRVAQPRPDRAAQISKTGGAGAPMIGVWTTPNTR